MRAVSSDLIVKEDCMGFERVDEYLKDYQGLYYVYFLVDPFTYQIKYVGRGEAYLSRSGYNSQVNQRCLDHYYEKGSSLKHKWIKKLKAKGVTYKVVIWELLSDGALINKQEENFIYMLGRKGYDNKGTLFNVSKKQGDFGGVSKHTLTTEEFIQRAIKVHGDKYSYTISVYSHNKEDIDILCPIHGKFTQRASHHLEGTGCSKCGLKKQGHGKGYGKTVLTTEEYIAEAILKHGDNYNYAPTVYKNTRTKVSILCNRCNKIFDQNPNNHKRGAGCPNLCYKR